MVPVTGARITVFGRLRLGINDCAARLVHLAAQRIDLLLARTEFDQFVGLLQRVDAVQRIVISRLRVVHHLLRDDSVLKQASCCGPG